jgi:maltose O-acetyltransferase
MGWAVVSFERGQSLRRMRVRENIEDILGAVPFFSTISTFIENPREGIRAEISRLSSRFQIWRNERRWRQLRALGMRIGHQVNLPYSTWIDTAHCHLISIGDFCGFGDGCLILAHDAMCNEWLDATRLGRVTIHESCHFGARTLILPGVEIGPRVVVGSGSIVTKSIPANSVAAGNPAKVICSLDDLLDKQRERMKSAAIWNYEQMSEAQTREAFRQNMRDILDSRDGFVVGGMSATRQGRGNAVTR